LNEVVGHLYSIYLDQLKNDFFDLSIKNIYTQTAASFDLPFERIDFYTTTINLASII